MADFDQTQAIVHEEEEDLTDEIDPEEGRTPIGYLKVLRQKGVSESSHALYEGDNIIGRCPDTCHVCVPSKSLSKEHACIQVQGESVLIFDKGSRNKTRRGKMFLTPEVRYEIKDEDMIIFADIKCLLQTKKAVVAVADSGSDTDDESLLLHMDVTAESVTQSKANSSNVSGPVATMVLSESESEDESVLRAAPQTSVLCEDSDPDASMDKDMFGAATQAYGGLLSAATQAYGGANEDDESDDDESIDLRGAATQAYGDATKKGAAKQKSKGADTSARVSSQLASTQSFDTTQKSATSGTQVFEDTGDKKNDSCDSSTRPTQVFDDSEDEGGKDKFFAMSTLAVEDSEVVDDSDENDENDDTQKTAGLDEPTQCFSHTDPTQAIQPSHSVTDALSVSKSIKKNMLKQGSGGFIVDNADGKVGNEVDVNATLVIQEEDDEDDETVVSDTVPIADDKAVDETVHISEDDDEREEDTKTKSIKEALTDTMIVAEDSGDESDQSDIGMLGNAATQYIEPLPDTHLQNTSKASIKSLQTQVLFDDEEEEEEEEGQGANDTSKAISNGATQAYALIEEQTQAYGEGPTQAYGLTNEGPTQAYGLTSEEPTQAYGLTNEEPTQAYGLTNEGPTQAFGLTNEEPTQVYGLTNEAPTQVYGLTTEEPTQVFTNEGPTQAYGLTSEEPTQEYGLDNLQNTSKSSIKNLQTQVLFDDEEEEEEGQGANDSSKAISDGATQAYGLTSEGPTQAYDVDEEATQQFDNGDDDDETDDEGLTDKQLDEDNKESVGVALARNIPTTSVPDESESDEEEELLLVNNEDTPEDPVEEEKPAPTLPYEMAAEESNKSNEVKQEKEETTDVSPAVSLKEAIHEKTNIQSPRKATEPSEPKSEDNQSNVSKSSEISPITSKKPNEVQNMPRSRRGKASKETKVDEVAEEKEIKAELAVASDDDAELTKPAPRGRRGRKTVAEKKKDNITEVNNKTPTISTTESPASGLKSALASHRSPSPAPTPKRVGFVEPASEEKSSDTARPSRGKSVEAKTTQAENKAETVENTSTKRSARGSRKTKEKTATEVLENNMTIDKPDDIPDENKVEIKPEVLNPEGESATEVKEEPTEAGATESANEIKTTSVRGRRGRPKKPTAANVRKSLAKKDKGNESDDTASIASSVDIRTLESDDTASMASSVEPSTRKSRRGQSPSVSTTQDSDDTASIASITSSVADLKDVEEMPAPTAKPPQKRGRSSTVKSNTVEAAEPRTSSRGRRISASPYLKDFETDAGKKEKRLSKAAAAKGKKSVEDSGPVAVAGTAEVETEVAEPSAPVKKGRGRSSQVGKKVSNVISTSTKAEDEEVEGKKEASNIKEEPKTEDKDSTDEGKVENLGRGSRKRGAKDDQESQLVTEQPSKRSKRGQQKEESYKDQEPSEESSSNGQKRKANESHKEKETEPGLDKSKKKKKNEIQDASKETVSEKVVEIALIASIAEQPTQNNKTTQNEQENLGSTRRKRKQDEPSKDTEPVEQDKEPEKEEQKVVAKKSRRGASKINEEVEKEETISSKKDNLAVLDIKGTTKPLLILAKVDSIDEFQSVAAPVKSGLQSVAAPVKSGRGKRGRPGKAADDSQASQDTDSQVSSASTRRSRQTAGESTQEEDSQASATSSLLFSSSSRARGKKDPSSHIPSQAESETSITTAEPTKGRRQSKIAAKPKSAPEPKTTSEPKAASPQGKRGNTQDSQEVSTPSRRGPKAAAQTKAPSTPVKSGNNPAGEQLSSPSLRKSTTEAKPRVMFTGVIDEQGEKIVRDLGGELALCIQDCTHLITDKIRRTVKFLAGLAKGAVIVNPLWLASCKQAGMFLDGHKFLLRDPAMEKQHNFSLRSSLATATSCPLLSQWSVYVTPSVMPGPGQMKDILECAGAKFLISMPTKAVDKTVVVSCPADEKLCQAAIKAGIPVVGAEFVLTGMLRQEVDLESHFLFSGSQNQSSGSRTKKK